MVLVVVLMDWTVVEVGEMVQNGWTSYICAVGPSCSCHKWIEAGDA